MNLRNFPNGMKIVGISSATKVISIGLVDDDKVLIETTVDDIRAEKILFYIDQAGIKPEQIEGVAVAAGPGSYSGLRGGLAVAKSLAESLNVPLVGVSTLEAIAYNLIDSNGTIAAILDAKRDDYSFALFSVANGKLKRQTDDLVLTIDGIAAKLSEQKGEVHLTGNLKEIRVKMKKNDGIHFAEDTHSHPYGINVARLGLLKIKAGQIEDPQSFVPKYSHVPNIREYKK
jgi:tRNA threonylcarbamoyladenosine biosynthesis protein TsaB